MAQKQNGDPNRVVAVHRKARFEYEVIDTVEAGLVLKGTEVKALRQAQMSLDESYAKIDDGEAWLVGANIPEYTHGNQQNHEPKRRRKLLMHRREIRKLKEQTQQKGLTLVPLKVWFSAKGLAKVTVGVCRGRKTHDKRQHLKDREAKKEMRG